MPEFLPFEVFRSVGLAVLIPLAISFLIIAVRLIRVIATDAEEYVRNQERSPSLRAIIRGEAPTLFDGARDERVMAGLAVDTNKNVWVEQGKLSEEAVSSVIR